MSQSSVKKACEFGRNKDDMIREKLVFSINDTRLKERVLRDNDLTLRKAIETCICGGGQVKDPGSQH